jgi:hypothetical protein
MKINLNSKVLPYVVSLGSLLVSTLLIKAIGMPLFALLAVIALIFAFKPERDTKSVAVIPAQRTNTLTTKEQQRLTAKAETKRLTGASK